MKKVLFSLLMLSLVTFACAPHASRAVTDATIPTETTVSKDAGTIEAGHKIFTTKCTKCHQEKPIQKWTYNRLRPILGAMVQKAKLNSTEIDRICAYVYANSKK